MNAKRGYVPEDERNFSPEAMEILKKASRHICYLLDEGYDLKQATVFVGNHFLLSERQRLAIMRSVASEQQLAERGGKKTELQDLAGKEVWIDVCGGMLVTMKVDELTGKDNLLGASLMLGTAATRVLLGLFEESMTV